MNSDVKVALIIVGGIVAVAMSISFSFSWYMIATHNAAIQAGYEQTTLPGESGVHWVKPKEEGGE